jgi:rhamnulose-1-phosphate aldolase
MIDKILKDYYNSIAKTAKRIDNNGWSEAGSGNMSLILNSKDKDKLNNSDLFKSKKINKFKTDIDLNNLIDSIIIITNRGARMREISEFPHPLTSLLKIENNNSYKILSENNIITSEWETHLGLLNKFSGLKDNRKAIIHIHSSEIIAFTHIKKEEKRINELLRNLIHELNIFLPKGIGFIKHFETGSKDLVNETIKKLGKYKISFWEKHGIISSGIDLDTAMDYIEIINQAIKVFFYLNRF